jgi:hypothetical protein
MGRSALAGFQQRREEARKMSRGKWAVVLAAIAVLAAAVATYAARKPKREGTDWKELAARKLPAPSGLSVAVLPFGAPVPDERQVEMPRACILLNVQRHGFKIVPEAASLSLVPVSTDKAMALERKDKLSAQWGREEAVEAGRKLGADWVIYGEWTVQHDFRVKTGLFVREPVKKQVRLSLHLVLADVKSGEVLYWSRLEDEAQGSSTATGFSGTDEDRKVARDILVGLVSAVVDDIAKALPKHEVGPEVTREQLDKLIGAMGL